MMNTKNLKYYRERLFALQSRLRNDVVQITDVMREDTFAIACGEMFMAPTHAADSSADIFDRDFTLLHVNRKDRVLELIQMAFRRMNEGLYGVCAECNTKIPQVRLNAIPYAIHCVNCASQHESLSAYSL